MGWEFGGSVLGRQRQVAQGLGGDRAHLRGIVAGVLLGNRLDRLQRLAQRLASRPQVPVALVAGVELTRQAAAFFVELEQDLGGLEFRCGGVFCASQGLGQGRISKGVSMLFLS